MRRMHVYQNHAVRVLGQNIDTVHLRQCKAKRRHFGGLAVARKRGLSNRQTTWHTTIRDGGCTLRRAVQAIERRLLLSERRGTGRGKPHRSLLRYRLRQLRCYRWCNRWSSVARTQFGECTIERAKNKPMHFATVTKAHLVLGWVHVDINPRRVEL